MGSTDPLDGASEPREVSGMTSRLILEYVKREGGRAAVDAVLERSGLSDREEQLRDESYWFAARTRMRLFDAAAEVLDDPAVGRSIGRAAAELNVGTALKLAMRAFGSPRLVFANVPRMTSRFTWVHRWDVEQLGASSARLRYLDVAGVGYHRHGCGFNLGLLSQSSAIFGLPPAEVKHVECALRGHDACVYEVRWQTSSARLRRTTAIWGTPGAGAVAAAALWSPALLPVAAAGLGACAAVIGRQVLLTRRREVDVLAAQLREQREVADGLAASLGDLVSNLQLAEVLDKITHNAKIAAAGKEFALLVPEHGGVRCRSSSGIPPASLELLESWAGEEPALFEESHTLERFEDVEPLSRLVPFGSLRAIPLRYGDQRLGILVALAHGPGPFLEADTALLDSYAAQAAIALANARLVDRLETLASHDSLTGLPNHGQFHDAVERELDRSRRHQRCFSVALLDLDGFKQVNDKHGHGQGDRVLREVAQVIADACRESDLTCRIGGDEFGLLLPETDASAAVAAVRRIESEIERLGVGVRLSAGVASWPADGATKDILLDRADQAMYAEKRARVRQGRLAVAEHRAGIAAGADRETVATFLSALMEQLDMDVAFLSEFVDGEAVFRVVAGSGESFGLVEGGAFPLEAGYCQRVIQGALPSLIPDARNDPRVKDMELTRLGGIGTYVGVPVHLSDSRIFGMLCCLSHEASPQLGQRDIRFLRALAKLMADQLEYRGLQRENQRLQAEFMGVHALVAALDARDRYTGEHSKTVVQLSVRVGRALGLPDGQLREIEQVGLLHDIGKVGIPDSVLQKPCALDREEWAIMRDHPVIGARIISAIDSLAHLAPLIRAEHERWDGAGYPDGLSGAEIPIASRIVFACDAYHAMTSLRPYRPAMSVTEAVAELEANAGRQFDPNVVAALVDLLGLRDVSDQSVADEAA